MFISNERDSNDINDIEQNSYIKKLHFYIVINKPPPYAVFLDTHFFCAMFKQQKIDLLARELNDMCEKKKVRIIVSDLILGELEKWRLQKSVMDLIGNYLQVVHAFHITANQLLQALCSFIAGKRIIQLSYNILTSDPLVIGKEQLGLKNVVNIIANELNKLRYWSNPVGKFIDVYREVWRDILQPYGKIFCEEACAPKARYEEFWFTNMYTDLPAICIPAYLFGMLSIIKQIYINDVVDIVTLSELLPFVHLYVTDKEMVHLCTRLRNKYPDVFDPYFRSCEIVSGLEPSVSSLKHILNL